jgi:hypothetical protein
VNFKIFYRKGTSNGKPDALLRRLEYHPEKGGGCHGVVPILLGELLDLGKRPLSVAMATGISMVRLVALATSPSASLA